MPTLQEYARLPVFADNIRLSQTTSVEITLESGQIAVDTFEGLAGFTPGSGRARVRFGFAVPIGGQEYDFWSTAAEGQIVTVQVGVGAKSYAGKGKLMSVSISGSVNASVEGSAEWEGEMKPLE